MKTKILVLTHSAGFVHDYLPVAEKTIQEIGRTSGEFKVVIRRDSSRVNWRSLKADFAAVLFASSGELPVSDSDKDSFMGAIGSGVGFVGVHNAAATFYEFHEYGEMVGGYFHEHPWTQEINARVEDHDHPATEHLGSSFKVKEEVYTFKNWSRSSTRVLMSLDNDSVDLSKGTRRDNDYALCWCHNYRAGRVFYTAFGHFPELWSQDWFRGHLLGGILWAMKVR